MNIQHLIDNVCLEQKIDLDVDKNTEIKNDFGEHVRIVLDD